MFAHRLLKVLNSSIEDDQVPSNTGQQSPTLGIMKAKQINIFFIS